MEGRRTTGPDGTRAATGAAGAHVVHFYVDDAHLVPRVVAFLAEGLDAAEGAVVIATADHAAAIEAGLGATGVDVATARRDGRLAVTSAEDTLRAFMVDDAPDRDRFTSAVRPLLEAARGRAGVRAYGEMVACLWRDGNVAAALELERCWNRLSATTPFSLYCSYPSAVVGGARHLSAFETACRLHGDVFVDEDAVVETSAARTFLPEMSSVAHARRFVCGVLAELGREDLAQSASLVVSELATNAVSHAKSEYTVTVVPTVDRVRVTVRDGSATFPSPPCGTPAPTERSGRGLLIVDSLSAGWGVAPRGRGKGVWAEVMARAGAGPAEPDARRPRTSEAR